MTDPERNNLGNIIRQVYQQWLMSNNVYREDPSLTNDSMLSDLRLNAILVLGEVENIRSKITTSERQLELFLNILPAKTKEGLNVLVKCLYLRNLTTYIAELKAVVDRFNLGAIFRPPIPESIAGPPKSLLTLLEEMITNEVNEEVKFWDTIFSNDQDPKENSFIKIFDTHVSNDTAVLIRQNKVRCDKLSVARLLNVLNGEFKKLFAAKVKSTNVTYKDMFHDNVTRIVIEGEPGVGKSWYLQRIAYRWARDPTDYSAMVEDNLDENKLAVNDIFDETKLKICFDFVIYIELKELSLCTIEKYILEKFKRADGIEHLLINMEIPNNRVLLLLDGFDDLDKSTDPKKYAEAESLVLGRKFPFVTVVVSSRPNYIKTSDPYVDTKWFLLKGIQTDQQPEINVDDRLLEEGLDQNATPPLFTEMQKFLGVIDEPDTTDSERYQFEITKRFIDHLAAKQDSKRLAKHLPAIGNDNRLETLSNYAFKLMPKENQLGIQFTYETDEPKIREEVAEINDVGVLRKRRRFYGDKGVPVNSLEFAHQVFADYFASRFVSKQFASKFFINKFYILIFPAMMSVIVGSFFSTVPASFVPFLSFSLSFLFLVYNHYPSLRKFMNFIRVLLIFYVVLLIVQYVIYYHFPDKLSAVSKFIMVLAVSLLTFSFIFRIMFKILLFCTNTVIFFFKNYFKIIIFLAFIVIFVIQIILLFSVTRGLRTK